MATARPLPADLDAALGSGAEDALRRERPPLVPFLEAELSPPRPSVVGSVVDSSSPPEPRTEAPPPTPDDRGATDALSRDPVAQSLVPRAAASPGRGRRVMVLPSPARRADPDAALEAAMAAKSVSHPSPRTPSARSVLGQHGSPPLGLSPGPSRRSSLPLGIPTPRSRSLLLPSAPSRVASTGASGLTLPAPPHGPSGWPDADDAALRAMTVGGSSARSWKSWRATDRPGPAASSDIAPELGALEGPACAEVEAAEAAARAALLDAEFGEHLLLRTDHTAALDAVRWLEGHLHRLCLSPLAVAAVVRGTNAVLGATSAHEVLMSVL